MFLLFGYGARQKILGPGEIRTCPRCGNTTQWTRTQEFKQFTLFFVPVARWNRRLTEVCGICGAAVAG
ncbi:zinc-ribbon domain-containing protein [Mycolicibacterium thermoresistibile]